MDRAEWFWLPGSTRAFRSSFNGCNIRTVRTIKPCNLPPDLVCSSRRLSCDQLTLSVIGWKADIGWIKADGAIRGKRWTLPGSSWTGDGEGEGGCGFTSSELAGIISDRPQLQLPSRLRCSMRQSAEGRSLGPRCQHAPSSKLCSFKSGKTGHMEIDQHDLAVDGVALGIDCEMRRWKTLPS
jgi:hypothetical protein